MSLKDKKYFGRSTLVGQRPMKSLSSVRLSVRPIGSLVFSDVVHDDSWPWYLVTDETRFLKKIFGGPNLSQMGQNRAWN